MRLVEFALHFITLSFCSLISLFSLSSSLGSLSGATFGYFAEYLDQKRTNPYAVWLKYNRPAYPNETIVDEMLHAQVRDHKFDEIFL